MTRRGMTPSEILGSGAKLLESVLAPEGFIFTMLNAGPSSGGDFAGGEFRRHDRHLDLHFRYSLGLVAYHVEKVGLFHEEYVRAVRAVDHITAPNSYPGFSDDWSSQFQALSDDLRCFGERFLRGPVDGFGELQAWLAEHPKPRGFAAL